MRFKPLFIKLWSFGRPLRRLYKRSRKVYLWGVFFPWLEPILLLDQRLAEANLSRWVTRHRVSWKPRLLFVHIPKSGGTSVIQGMSDHLDGLVVLKSAKDIYSWVKSNHGKNPEYLTLDHLQPDILIRTGLMTRKQLDSTVSFAVVRDDDQRFESCYLHHQRHHFIPKSVTREKYQQLIKRPNLGSTRWANIFGLSHARPQNYWLNPSSWNGPQIVLSLSDTQQIEGFLGTYCGSTFKLGHYNRAPEPK